MAGWLVGVEALSFSWLLMFLLRTLNVLLFQTVMMGWVVAIGALSLSWLLMFLLRTLILKRPPPCPPEGNGGQILIDAIVFKIFLCTLKRPPPCPPQGFHVIVVGAGPGGIAMGKRLNDMGIRWNFC